MVRILIVRGVSGKKLKVILITVHALFLQYDRYGKYLGFPRIVNPYNVVAPMQLTVA